MHIFIISSKHFYDKIPSTQAELEALGHTVTLPNCHDAPETEDVYRKKGEDMHSAWKSKMIQKSEEVMRTVDGVLVLNYQKNGKENYIGGATFLEMYDAFRLGKKIFMMNPIPEGILRDEIAGFQPTILNRDLEKIA